MEIEHRHLEIIPRVVPADAEVEIAIRPRHDHMRFEPRKSCRVEHFLMDGPRPGESSTCVLDRKIKPGADGVLRVRSRFWGEQEHCLQITPAPGGRRPSAEVRVYSLASDLFARRPYKGDTHMHSFRSDGRESPAYVAAACRRIGLDFMAVTDHGQYQPSIDAIRAYRGVKIDMAVHPGEEVHPPEVPVHLVNFGGRFSVNERFRGARYRREVARLEARLAGTLPQGVVPAHAAGCLWALERIREAGGLSVFCHPHWVHACAYNVAEPLNDWLFRERPFDAFELVGGYWRSTRRASRAWRRRWRGCLGVARGSTGRCGVWTCEARVPANARDRAGRRNWGRGNQHGCLRGGDR